jgi:hypothetical protein
MKKIINYKKNIKTNTNIIFIIFTDINKNNNIFFNSTLYSIIMYICINKIEKMYSS